MGAFKEFVTELEDLVAQGVNVADLSVVRSAASTEAVEVIGRLGISSQEEWRTNLDQYIDVYSPLVQYLRRNAGNAFCDSLLAHYEKNGGLSEKQAMAVLNGLRKEYERANGRRVTAPVATPSAAPERTYGIKAGNVLTIKTWIAKKLQQQTGMDFFFRNLEVVGIHAETEKAYSVTVRFVSHITSCCHVCGRDLDNDISRATGIGPVCAERIGLSRPSLTNAKKTLEELESLRLKVGNIGPLWIPKSQIVSVDAQPDQTSLAI